MKLTIIGASGHGKVVAEVALHCGYDEIEFLDDNDEVKTCGKWPVVGKTEEAAKTKTDLFIAIGNARVRKALFEKFGEDRIVTLIHPNSIISESASIGSGSVVMAGVIINPEARIGKGCIINTASSVDHDCVLDDFVHVAVGSHLSGTVRVGEKTWIGTGVIVSNNVDICADCMIGAGAVVVDSIAKPGTYVGVPAKRITY